MYISTDPFTGIKKASYNTCTGAEVNDICEVSRAAYEQWHTTGMADRVKLLLKLAELLKNFKFSFADTITSETGKLLREAVAEVEKCAGLCEYYAAAAPDMLKPEIIKSDAGYSEVRRDPLGGIAIFMPWNFPFWQVLRCAVPAVMAGNTVVLKHAYNVPECAIEIIDVFRRAGFPEGVIQNVFLLHHDIEALIAHPFIKAVSVTGSEKAGEAVGSAAGKHLKKCVAELGGSDPFIIFEDADFENTANAAFASRMICTGQSCIAGKRFIVHKKHYDNFLKLMCAKIDALVTGNPKEESTSLSPLATPVHVDNLTAQVKGAIKKGAVLHHQKKLKDLPASFFAPCILTDFDIDNPAWQQEFFGPVFSVKSFETEEEALALANASTYGLGASLWTEDIEKANRLIPRINAGNVFVNGIVKSVPALPFGGINRSGYGRELSARGLTEFVNLKTVWIA